MSQTELLLGDTAPEMRVEAFLKGEPIPRFAPGTVHVVAFWATWCGPCKASIPHLTALQGRYPTVPIIGVAVTWKDLGELEAFVLEQGDAIGYRIAADAPPEPGARRGRMHGAWCEAAYQQGVPTAFVVDGAGRIAWIGHPMEIDAPLAAIVDGSWDLPARIAEHRAALDRDKVREARAMAAAVSGRLAADDRPGAVAVYDACFADHPELERLHGISKLKLLLQAKDAGAVDYARHLCARVVHDDVNMLFVIGTVLAETADAPIGEAFPARAAALLAVEALERAESLIGDEATPSLVMRLSQAIARALLAAGLDGAAAARIARARAAALEAGAPGQALAELDALAARCGRILTPAPPTAPGVICEGDSCRLADG